MKHSQRGMTLMELMVVMAIIGILASIAIPAYRRYVVRANRTEAKTALMQTAQALERCYTNSSPYQYDSAVCSNVVTGVVLPYTTPNGNYRVTGAIGPTAYVLTATPLGTQLADDSDCAAFTLDQRNNQTVTGTLPWTQCWGR